MIYDFAVVGSGGLIGSAATKYLSATGRTVAGVGSPEPKDFSQHNDVFASHYDDARVTRILDANPVWAGLAAESMKRFETIQTQSGVAFYSTVGCLRIGTPETITALVDASAAFGATFTLLDHAALQAQFGHIDCPADMVGVIERGRAGTLAPRALVRAQLALAEQNGAHVYEDVVMRIETAGAHCVLHLKSGTTLNAAKVLVAAGAFTNFHDLLPLRLPYKAMPETVVLMPVPETLFRQNVPALIYYRWFNEVAQYLYATPPLRADDGRYYIKAGAVNDGVEAQTLEHAVDYFRSGGNRVLAARLAEGVHTAIPATQLQGYTLKPCILANTATGLPYISAVIPERLYVAAGGCGAAAKSSDELGRLAADLVLGRDDCAQFRL